MAEQIGTIDVNFVNYDGKTRPKRSESITKLASALSKAQGQIENAAKDAKGTFSKYATLASTWDAIRKPLADNELSVYQRPLKIDQKTYMCTMILHASGEFLDDAEMEMVSENNGRMSAMQALGSAVTYARRYCLQAAVGIAPADDDDGAGAGDPKDTKPAPISSPTEDKKPGRYKTDFANSAIAQPKDDTLDKILGKTTLDDLYEIVARKKLADNQVIWAIERSLGRQVMAKDLSAQDLETVFYFISNHTFKTPPKGTP